MHLSPQCARDVPPELQQREQQAAQRQIDETRRRTLALHEADAMRRREAEALERLQRAAADLAWQEQDRARVAQGRPPAAAVTIEPVVLRRASGDPPASVELHPMVAQMASQKVVNQRRAAGLAKK